MAITIIRCHVLQSTISMVTDFEDNVMQVICPEYDHSTGMCRSKQRHPVARCRRSSRVQPKGLSTLEPFGAILLHVLRMTRRHQTPLARER